MRRPVEIASRQGSQAGEIQNRGQYLRPAADTQNTRMLARAFSEINSATGRVANNSMNIRQQKRNDELADVKAYQQEQNDIAQQLGALSALTGEDYTDQFWNNPVNVLAYQQQVIAGEADAKLAEMANEFQSSPAYGDPASRDQALAFWADNAAGMIEGLPPELAASFAARASQVASSNLNASDKAAAEFALEQTQQATTDSLMAALMTSETPEEAAAILMQKRNELFQLHGANRGLDMFDGAMEGLQYAAYTMPPEQSARMSNALKVVLSNEDMVKDLGTARIGAMVTTINKMDRYNGAALSAANAKQAAIQQQQVDKIMGEMLANPSEMNQYYSKLVETTGSHSEAQKVLDDTLDIYTSVENTQFLPDTIGTTERSHASLMQFIGESKGLETYEQRMALLSKARSSGLVTKEHYLDLQGRILGPQKTTSSLSAQHTKHATVFSQELVRSLPSDDIVDVELKQSEISNTYKSYMELHFETHPNSTLQEAVEAAEAEVMNLPLDEEGYTTIGEYIHELFTSQPNSQKARALLSSPIVERYMPSVSMDSIKRMREQQEQLNAQAAQEAKAKYDERTRDSQ